MLNATVFFDFQTPCCRCRFQDDDDKHIIKRDHFHLCRFSPIEARNSKSFMVFLPQRFPCHWRLRNDFRSGLGMHAKMWTNGRRRIFAKVQNDIPMLILKLQLTLSNPHSKLHFITMCEIHVNVLKIFDAKFLKFL